MNEVCNLIARSEMLRYTGSPCGEFIACENGWLDRKLNLIAPDPEFFVTHKVRARYDPRLIGQCPAMNRLIEIQSQGVPARIKRAWQALCFIICNIVVKKFLFIFGAGDSGKSTLLRFIDWLCDYDSFPLSPEQFPDTHSLNELSGKKLAICGELDLSKSLLNASTVARIKAITGGDSISAQGKYKDPAKLITEGGLRTIFESNYFIMPKEPDAAFMRRMILLCFPVSVPPEQQNPQLFNDLTHEASAIFTTAMQEYPALQASNFAFAGEEETWAVAQEYRVQTNRSLDEIILEFCANHLTTGSDSDFITTDTIWKAFQSTTSIPVAKAEFGKALKAFTLSVPGVEEGRQLASIDPSKPHGYRGLQLKY